MLGREQHVQRPWGRDVYGVFYTVCRPVMGVGEKRGRSLPPWIPGGGGDANVLQDPWGLGASVDP